MLNIIEPDDKEIKISQMGHKQKMKIELNKISLKSESFDYIGSKKNMYEKQSRNNNRSSDTIASFLLKTYQILQHPEYERMISWDKTNVGFIIHDVVSFTRQILPKYFRHSNFSSFVRQLNMYDFHKVKQENQSLVFKNPLFCKGQQQNLKFIRRKAAKKVGGQRKPHNNDRVDAQNQKYENLLKGFKKSFETEINHSSFFYERSIQLMKDLNESNIKKQECIRKLNKKQEHYETAEQDKEKNEEKEAEIKIPMATEEQQNQKKDTIIQIPKQFLSVEEPEGSEQGKENKNPQDSETKETNVLNIDRVMQLKEQLYKSLGIYQSWLQDYIEINKKKVKYMSSTRQQLVKCRQNKSHENQEINYPINSNQNYKQESHQQEQQNQHKNEQQKLVSLEELNEKNQLISYEAARKNDTCQIKQESLAPIQMGNHIKGILPTLRLFEQPRGIEKSQEHGNGSAGLQPGGFTPINESFSSRLFSTFRKPKEERAAVEESEQSACDWVSSRKSDGQGQNESQSEV